MPKNTVQDWSTNADSNTDIGGVDISEGCPPAGINNAIRGVMSQIAAFIANAVFTAISVVNNLTVGGNASVTGTLSGATVQFGDGNFFATIAGGNPALSVGTNSYIGYVRTSGTYNFVIAGTAYASLSNAGLVVTGAVTASGQGSFGSLNVSGNAAIGGALSVTGGVTSNNDIVVTNGSGRSSLLASGDLVLARSGGASAAAYFNTAKSAYVFFNGTLFSLSNTLSVTGDIKASGNTYPANGDGSFYLTFLGASPAIVFDTGDYLYFDRSANKAVMVIGNSAVFSIDSTGTVRAKGNVIANTTP